MEQEILDSDGQLMDLEIHFLLVRIKPKVRLLEAFSQFVEFAIRRFGDIDPEFDNSEATNLFLGLICLNPVLPPGS